MSWLECANGGLVLLSRSQLHKPGQCETAAWLT